MCVETSDRDRRTKPSRDMLSLTDVLVKHTVKTQWPSARQMGSVEQLNAVQSTTFHICLAIHLFDTALHHSINEQQMFI